MKNGIIQHIFMCFFIIGLLGCGPPPEDDTVISQVEFSQIQEIIYDGVGTRLENQGSYSSNSGSIALVFEGDGASGTFRMSMSDFGTPDLCAYMQPCSCTGVLVGSYTEVAGPTLDGSETGSEPYNPLTDTGDDQPPDLGSPTDVTTTYLALNINFQASSLSSTCPAQADRTVKVQVFDDKSIIYTDSGKDYFFEPRKLDN